MAAGEGRRFGGGELKQFALLAGTPLVLRSVDAFRAHPRVDGVSLVLPQRVLEAPPGWLQRLETADIRLVAGGATRTDSVRRGLSSVPADVKIVAIHDGARPLITSEAIERVIEAVGEERGAIVGRPVTDSLKEVDERGFVLRSASRGGIWHAETPQAFPRERIEEIHRRAYEDGVSGSDSAALCERYGLAVVAVELQEPNLKVTRPADLELAEAWVRRAARAERDRAGG